MLHTIFETNIEKQAIGMHLKRGKAHAEKNYNLKVKLCSQ